MKETESGVVNIIGAWLVCVLFPYNVYLEV
jgi:hypothetical protein